jgi:hypothetical protein
VIRWPTDSEEVALARELRNRGVLFDEDEFERMRVDALGLSIHQNNDVPSTVFSLGHAIYVMSAVIRNDSSRALSPSRIRFDGPTWESGIGLMKNPTGSRKRLAGFPGDRLFGDGLILNYLITLRRPILLPGDLVKGVWLAEGQAHMPCEYRDGDLLKVRVTLFDQRGRYDQKLFWLKVEWSGEETRRIQKLEGMS